MSSATSIKLKRSWPFVQLLRRGKRLQENAKRSAEQLRLDDGMEEFVRAVYFTFFGRLPSAKDVSEKSRLDPDAILSRCIHSREFLQKVVGGAVSEGSWYPDDLRSFRWLPALADAFGIRERNGRLPGGADTTREALLQALCGCLIDPKFEGRLDLEPAVTAALVRFYHRLSVAGAYAELERLAGRSTDRGGRTLLDALAPMVDLIKSGSQPNAIHAALREAGLIGGLRRSMGRLSPEGAQLVATMLDSAIDYAKLQEVEGVPREGLEAFYGLLRGLIDEFKLANSSDPSSGQRLIGGSIAADGFCASLDFLPGSKVAGISVEPFSFQGKATQCQARIDAFPFLDGQTSRHFATFESPLGLSDLSLYVIQAGAGARSLVALTVSDLLKVETAAAERYGPENEATFLLTSRNGAMPAVQLSDGVTASEPVSILQRRKAAGAKSAAAGIAGEDAQFFAVFDRHGDLSLVAETGQVLWTGSIAGAEGNSSFAREVLREIEVFAIEQAIGTASISDLNSDRRLHFVFDLRGVSSNEVFEEYLGRLSGQAKVTLMASDMTLPLPAVDSPQRVADLLQEDETLIFVKGPAVVSAQAVRLHLLSLDPGEVAVGAVTEMGIDVVHGGGLALAVQPCNGETRQDVLIAGRVGGLSFLETGDMQGRPLQAPLGWRVPGTPDAAAAIVLYSNDTGPRDVGGGNFDVIEIRVPDREDDADAHDRTLGLLEDKLKLGLPVIFLGDLDYPRTYIRRCIEAYHRYGGADLITVQTTLGDDCLNAEHGLFPIARQTAPAFLTCLSPASALDHVRANPSRMFEAPVRLEHPMLVASLLSPPECQGIFPVPCKGLTPAERSALFRDERVRWNPMDLASGVNRARPISLQQALAVAKSCINEMGRARESAYDSAIVASIIEQDILQSLFEIGYLDLARTFLTELSNQNGQFFAKLGADALIRLSGFCLRHGVGADLASALAHDADILLDVDPAAILPVTDLFVCMLEEEQILAAFIQQARASAAGKGRGKSALRLIEAAKRHLGHETFLLLSSIITSNKRNKLAGNVDFRRHVAERAVAHPLGSERAWGESIRDLQLLLPYRQRLLNCLSDGDVGGFRVAFTDSVRRHGNAVEMLDTLRSFTFELSTFGDAGLRQELYRLCDAREKLILATILSDRKEIAEHIAFAPTYLGDAAVVCNSVLGDNESVGRFLSESLARHQLRPWNLAGDDLIGLFDHALTPVEANEGCPSRGKVSIIMSAFNSESALMSRAIRSVLLQSYGDFELLVVDDASDPTISKEIQAVCQGDPRVTLIRLPVNQGPYIGRDVALQMATGDYVAIQDSDDLAHPQRLQFQVDCLNSDELMMVTAYHARFDVRGCMQFEAHFHPIGDGTMTSMFRRELFDRVGPFLPVRSRGDVEFRERVLKMLGPAAHRHIEAPLMLCHASPGTLSNRTSSSNRHSLQLFRTIFSSYSYAPSYTSFETPQIPIPLAMRA